MRGKFRMLTKERSAEQPFHSGIFGSASTATRFTNSIANDMPLRNLTTIEALKQLIDL